MDVNDKSSATQFLKKTVSSAIDQRKKEERKAKQKQAKIEEEKN